MAINSKLTLNNDQFRAALEQSSGAIGALVADASIRFQTLYAQSDALNRRLSAGIGRFSEDLKSVGKSLTVGVSLPILALAGASISAYGEIDSLKRGLFSIEKTAENTEARFNSLKQVAALPGLGLEEAVKGDIRLRTVGIAADLSKKSLLEFGNAIALTGGGKADLDRVTTQLSQMSAKSKVLAQDLKPIIEAAPSVSQALQKMFGTVDSEEISSKLKAKGLNSTDFIGILVKEMEKLPRVSGGIKNAMENMGDSLKVAGYEFGLILDKNFGLSDMFNGLGNTINSVVDWFKQLSPELQKGILAFGGMVTVIGPLLLGLGSLVSMFAEGGILTGALAAITGPIGVAALAIVGLGTVIITNWDAIKKTLKETGIWDGLATVVQGTMDLISGSFSLLKRVVLGAYEYIKKIINTDTFGVFQNLGTFISTSLTVIGKVFSVFGKALSGDWSGVWQGLKDTVKVMFNGIVQITATNVSVITNLLSKLFNSIGATGVASTLKGVSEDVLNFAKIVQFNVPKSTSLLDGLAKSIEGVGGGSTPTPDFTGGGKEGKEKVAKPKLVADPANSFLKQFDDFKKDITAFKSKINIELKNVKFEQKTFDVNFKMNPKNVNLMDLVNYIKKDLDRINNLISSSGGVFRKEDTEMLTKRLEEQARELAQKAGISIEEAKGIISNKWDSFGVSIKQAQGAIAGGLAASIGSMITNGTSFSDAIKQFGGVLLGSLGDLFTSVGTQILQSAILFKGVQKFLANAITSPELGIVAGLGLIALGSAIKTLSSNVSSQTANYANGGGSGSSGGSSSSGSGFNNPYTVGGNRYQPMEILIKGETVTRGSDLVTTYTNQTSYQTRLRNR